VRIVVCANLALRFVLELCALAATAYWGSTTGSGVTPWLLAIGAPAVVIAVWALFVSPKATVELRPPLRLAIEFLVFGAAALGLAAAGRPTLAVAFAIVAAISGTLNYLWPERTITGSGRPP
jgi:hypothetical protein